MIQKFNFEKLPFDPKLQQPCLIDSFRATDDRGGLVKDFNNEVFASYGIEYEMKEVFYTESKEGVIRANHFQLPIDGRNQQAKIVRCIKGHVYDVITDLRPWSKTYKKWMGFDLTESNYKQLYIPEWFGHGYYVLEDSIVCYKANEVFSAGDSGIKWDDPDIGIDWKIPTSQKDSLIISDKDLNLMTFKEYDELIREKYSTRKV